jgi:hypothetical protein
VKGELEMERRVYLCAVIIFLASVFVACRKDPGEGGSSAIKGVLYAKNVQDHNAEVTPNDYEPNQRIYISYGDKPTYNQLRWFF